MAKNFHTGWQTKIEHYKYKKLVALILVLILLVTIPLTVYLNQRVQDIRQHAATSNCKTDDNLSYNCDFEDIGSNGFPQGWTDVRQDPKRFGTAGLYTDGVTLTTTAENQKTIQLGKETGTCAMPKTANGGFGTNFKLYPEIRQHTFVGHADSFTVSFDFQMKSRHTADLSAPFYVWAGFSPAKGRDDQGLGKEIFIAYTPNNAPGDFCTTPFRPDYKCMIGISGLNRGEEQSCDQAFSGWQHIDVSFPRAQLCKEGETVNPECMAKNEELFVGFGVTNDFDTTVLLDNVVIKASGVSKSMLPQKTTMYMEPSSLQEKETTSLTVTAPLECSFGFDFQQGNGLQCGNPVAVSCTQGNPKDSKPCFWQWQCTGNTPGNYSANFSVPGSPTCTVKQDYTIAAAPQQRANDPGESIDTLDYFISKHLNQGLTGTHPLSQTVDGQKAYLVKWDANTFEVHTWDNNNIYLKEDNSGAPMDFNTLSPGTWMKRHMAVGETVTTTQNTVQYYTRSCSPIGSAHPLPLVMTLERHEPNFNVGGDLGMQDVIVLKYDHPGQYERYYYSKEWGLIRWEEYNKTGNVKTNESVFNMITQSPIAPNKESVCDLSLLPSAIPPTATPIPTDSINPEEPTPTQETEPDPTATPIAEEPTPTETEVIATITNTPTSTITTTPTPQTNTLTLNVSLEGISTTPTRQNRPLTLWFYRLDDNIKTSAPVFTRTYPNALTYQNNSGTFTATNLPLSNPSQTFKLPPGTYTVLMSTDTYLRKQISGVSIQEGNTTLSQTQPLLAGDITKDNVIDILDYNAYINCFGNKKNQATCLYKNASDLNDDDKIDSLLDFSDYKLLIKNFGKEGI